ELGLERLGFGAELEGVLRIGRRGAPGLVARGRGLALLADDSGRTAALHAAPEHRPGTLSLPRFASSANFMVGVPPVCDSFHTAATRSRVSVPGAVAATRCPP